MIKMKNWIILFVFLLFSCLCESQSLKGFEFKDNLLEARFGPENGYAIYDPVLRDNTIYFDGIWTLRLHNEQTYNLRNKWNSFCMSLDIANDRWRLYINGKTNMTYTHNKPRKLNERFSDRTDLPMVIRLGHYYFDNKPLLGTILDFHVWDRYFTYKQNCECSFELLGQKYLRTDQGLLWIKWNQLY